MTTETHHDEDASLCSTCHAPCPRNYCWQQRLVGCGFTMPPRNLDLDTLVKVLAGIDRRLKALEQEDKP